MTTDSLRRQEIPGTAIIWTWHGTTSFVLHEVRLDLHGSAWHTVWAGDHPTQPRMLDALYPAEVEQYVAGMRRHQADRLAANRVLRMLGYQATEHTRRGDCNCATCQPS